MAAQRGHEYGTGTLDDYSVNPLSPQKGSSGRAPLAPLIGPWV